MLAHHLAGTFPAEGAEFDAPIVLHLQQAIPFKPCHRLTHRRPGLTQPLDDARAQWLNTLLVQLENGAQIHLSGVDQFAHASLPVIREAYRPPQTSCIGCLDELQGGPPHQRPG